MSDRTPLPEGHAFAGLTPPYSLLLVDPPWAYRDKANAGKRGAAHKYATMSVEEICALPVADLCAKDCLLAMWWVGPQPEEALRVVKAWGFRLVNMKGFSWRKLSRTGGAEHFGMGHWSRGNTEDCLFAVRGRPKRADAGVRQVINAPLREHSRKPDETRDRLVRLMGDVPRLEMFARQRVKGWTAWGLEAPAAEEIETVTVTTIPPEGLLESMALRFNHAFGMGCAGFTDQQIEDARAGIDVEGLDRLMAGQLITTREREVTLTTMAQLHEEVVGKGFYRYPTQQIAA